MSYTATRPRTYAEMTHEELFAAAVAAGATFEVKTRVLQLSRGPEVTHMLEVGSGTLGVNPARDRVLFAVQREMQNRWAAFTAFVKAKLVAAA